MLRYQGERPSRRDTTSERRIAACSLPAKSITRVPGRRRGRLRRGHRPKEAATELSPLGRAGDRLPDADRHALAAPLNLVGLDALTEQPQAAGLFVGGFLRFSKARTRLHLVPGYLSSEAITKPPAHVPSGVIAKLPCHF